MEKRITPIDCARLRDAIFRAGLTQAKLARAVKVHPNILSGAINGRVNLYEEELNRLADFLGVHTEDLIHVA